MTFVIYLLKIAFKVIHTNLSNTFKCRTTVERSALSSSATSRVFVRGSASMILSIGYYQLPMASHCAPHLQGSRLLCKTS